MLAFEIACEALLNTRGGRIVHGRKLSWTKDARRAMLGIEDAYLRRRSKARIEKSARLRRLKIVTLEFAQKLIEEETGTPLAAAPASSVKSDADRADAEAGSEPAARCPVGDHAEDRRLIARDSMKTPLFSAVEWSEEAIERILRVPAGFMRDRTQERIEELSRQCGDPQISLARVEAGIELGLQTMAELIEANGDDVGNPERSEYATTAAKCPAVNRTEIEAQKSHREQPLNEVSQLTELTAMRMLLSKRAEPTEE